MPDTDRAYPIGTVSYVTPAGVTVQCFTLGCPCGFTNRIPSSSEDDGGTRLTAFQCEDCGKWLACGFTMRARMERQSANVRQIVANCYDVSPELWGAPDEPGTGGDGARLAGELGAVAMMLGPSEGGDTKARREWLDFIAAEQGGKDATTGD